MQMILICLLLYVHYIGMWLGVTIYGQPYPTIRSSGIKPIQSYTFTSGPTFEDPNHSKDAFNRVYQYGSKIQFNHHYGIGQIVK